MAGYPRLFRDKKMKNLIFIIFFTVGCGTISNNRTLSSIDQKEKFERIQQQLEQQRATRERMREIYMQRRMQQENKLRGY